MLMDFTSIKFSPGQNCFFPQASRPFLIFPYKCINSILELSPYMYTMLQRIYICEHIHGVGVYLLRILFSGD